MMSTSAPVATSAATARVAALYRYPVKGLSAEALIATDLSVGCEMAYDRRWAIEDAPGKFDPTAPRHLPKINFAMLMRHEALAALETQFDPATATLSIARDGVQIASGSLDTADGRAAIEACIGGVLAGKLRGQPKIVSAAGHTFSDVAMKCLHVINHASVLALEDATGRRIDPLRFRANVVLTGAPAWAELNWIGQTLRLGEAEVDGVKATERCAATEVDPSSGARDLDMLRILRDATGDTDFGVYVRVTKAGRVARGDAVVSNA